MSRRWLAALTILTGLAAAPAHAQEQIGWAHKLFGQDGKPILEHDFGTVPKGAILNHRFPITNIYAVPLTMSYRVSCDCVTVAFSKPTLQSREAGFIDVQMDTRRFNGPKVVSVTLTVANQQFASSAFLNIKGNCRTDVTLNPGGVSFGIVPRGNSPQAAVDIDYAGVLNWQITGATQNDLFKVDLTEKYRTPGRVGYRVQMALKADAPAGSFKQELALTTNDPASPTVPVPFEITVQSALAAFPELVKFTGAKVGTPVEYKLSVRGSAQKFNVTAIEGLGDGLEVVEPMPSAVAKPVHILTLRWTPAAAGPLNRKLTVKTDAGPTANVTVEGTAN